MGKNQRNWKTEHTPIDTKESRKVTPQKQKVLEICNDKITGLFLKLRCRHFFKTTCLKCFTWLKMSLTIMILQLILFISFRFFIVLLLEKLNTKRHAFFSIVEFCYVVRSLCTEYHFSKPYEQACYYENNMLELYTNTLKIMNCELMEWNLSKYTT